MHSSVNVERVSESRRVLLCPNCGAPPLPEAAAHETVTCAFCGIASVIAQIENPTEARGSERVCPRCASKLFFGEADGVEMLGCGACGGIWLDNASARKVMSRYDEAVAELAQRASINAKVRPDVRAAVNCAECGAPMTRRQVADVELDFCGEHGTWFDAGELERVIEPLRPAPAPFGGPAPVYENASPTPSFISSNVAADLAVGAFELLAAVLTD